MGSDEDPLSNILPFSLDYGPVEFLHTEIQSLQSAILSLYQEIQDRKGLEQKLLSGMESRENNLRSERMNIRPGYSLNFFERTANIETRLDSFLVEKTRARESSARDLIELNRMLRYYTLKLERKLAQLQMLK